MLRAWMWATVQDNKWNYQNAVLIEQYDGDHGTEYLDVLFPDRENLRNLPRTITK